MLWYEPSPDLLPAAAFLCSWFPVLTLLVADLSPARSSGFPAGSCVRAAAWRVRAVLQRVRAVFRRVRAALRRVPAIERFSGGFERISGAPERLPGWLPGTCADFNGRLVTSRRVRAALRGFSTFVPIVLEPRGRRHSTRRAELPPFWLSFFTYYRDLSGFCRETGFFVIFQFLLVFTCFSLGEVPGTCKL